MSSRFATIFRDAISFSMSFSVMTASSS